MEGVLVPAIFGGKICACIAVCVEGDARQFEMSKVLLSDNLVEAGHAAQIVAMQVEGLACCNDGGIG